MRPNELLVFEHLISIILLVRLNDTCPLISRLFLPLKQIICQSPNYLLWLPTTSPLILHGFSFHSSPTFTEARAILPQRPGPILVYSGLADLYAVNSTHPRQTDPKRVLPSLSEGHVGESWSHKLTFCTYYGLTGFTHISLNLFLLFLFNKWILPI